ncbi:eff [Symbiodinium sp. CCMP2592]|nr:eff [Symbiodinium sp. CCMP2592]
MGFADENAIPAGGAKVKSAVTRGRPLREVNRCADKGLAPSSAELEKRYIDAKRNELREGRLRNERSCHAAIHKPSVYTKLTTKATVPHEFNLSCSRRSVGACSEDSDMDVEPGAEWTSSLRRGRSSSRSRQPELTVPRGPRLHTSWRPRSTARGLSAEPREADVSWYRSLRSASQR